MSRAREAALLVHGLPEAARAEVLQALTENERATVLPLLQELQSLGIPALPYGEHDDIIAARPADLIERVAALDAAAAARALSRCAPATAAHLWGAEEWPWREAVLDLLDARYCDAVRRRQGAGSPPLAPRTTSVLLSRLLAEAGELPAAGDTRKTRRWFPWKR